MTNIYVLFLFMTTVSIYSMDNFVSSKDKTLTEVFLARRQQFFQDQGNPRYNIVYSYDEGQIDKKKFISSWNSMKKTIQLKIIWQCCRI